MSEPRARYVPISDAAAYLGCTDKTIRRLISAGKLAAFRLGKRAIRVDRADLDELMRPIPHARIGGSAA